MWELSAGKIRSIEDAFGAGAGTPVFTVAGKYSTQGWTEWTQGFQFGSAILQFDATGDVEFLEIGRQNTIQRMASHVTHLGVHDHGFNNVSTYGNLRRLMLEGRIADNPRELDFYELALKASGAVQAARWSETSDGHGYIYSFNGPHSLFSDTIRSLRVLALADRLGHRLMGENDVSVSLLDRLVQHARTTAKYNVYYGAGRDAYDVRGRVVHESIFNPNDGRYRCPSTQQGFSPFSTWTRGLAWIMTGYAEQLEFLHGLEDSELQAHGGRREIIEWMEQAARSACDYYLQSTPTDGVPYWDTGAPGLVHLSDYLDRPADPFNDHEPVDSSAAAIAAQGLLRLGRYMQQTGRGDEGSTYWQAGLTVLRTLLGEPYLSADAGHQGLLLHTIYHRPRGWDYVPEGAKIPRGESCMWGDYHLRELALYVQRIVRGEAYYTFFAPCP
ncbi:MAG: glycoside hydrolase family 88 protein [Pirellulaceae bacterium]|nr:glycoside hydrolase family 88 protein [Pirellulaceae bacterium]